MVSPQTFKIENSRVAEKEGRISALQETRDTSLHLDTIAIVFFACNLTLFLHSDANFG